jgi:protein-tyrosine-phosphatase/DNA-binding transcriptional ArsR family regulator
METSSMVERLSALAHGARLEVVRRLVRAGEQGLAAGELAAALGIPPPTLTFHLKHLVAAGLVQGRRRGRRQIYCLRSPGLREMLTYLGADCCQGRRALVSPLRSEADGPRSVLFLCSKNSARSQLAEVLLRAKVGDDLRVFSAGLRPEGVHPMTLQVLEEVGLDTSGCRAQDFGEFLGKVPIHTAIVVCERANEDCANLYPFAGERLYWPFEDPAGDQVAEGDRLARFREVRDAIDSRLEAWLSQGPEHHSELAG